MKFFRNLAKLFFVMCLLLCSAVFTLIYTVSQDISPSYKINRGDVLNISTQIPVTAEFNGAKMSQSTTATVGESFDVDLKIFGVIPFSTVSVEVVDEMYVSVLGNPFGMKIYTDGVLVIETSDVSTTGGKVNPAEVSGIKVGDYIKSVNGTTITCNEDLSDLVLQSKGSSMDFEIIRNNTTIHCRVKPVISTEDGIYRIGIWVRDSSAGIGTLTFYSPSTNVVCGLGHGICDSDTQSLLSVESGELVAAQIVSVEKGASGSPGELKGKFTYETIADIALNNEKGVFGTLYGTIDTSNLTEIALKQEVADGPAQILCTVNGEIPQLYSCEIKKRNSNYMSDTQNITVTVTDPQLIAATGGIVQGMSGAPILQDGKLVAALTHVLVDDPTIGYGIFAENMLETAQSVGNDLRVVPQDEQIKEAS